MGTLAQIPGAYIGAIVTDSYWDRVDFLSIGYFSDYFWPIFMVG